MHMDGHDYGSMQETTQALVEELFSGSFKNERCPHIKRDATGPYCGKGLVNNTEISDTRRMVCDTASLQLWCLNPNQGHKRCIYFRGESLD